MVKCPGCGAALTHYYTAIQGLDRFIIKKWACYSWSHVGCGTTMSYNCLYNQLNQAETEIKHLRETIARDKA